MTGDWQQWVVGALVALCVVLMVRRLYLIVHKGDNPCAHCGASCALRDACGPGCTCREEKKDATKNKKSNKSCCG